MGPRRLMKSVKRSATETRALLDYGNGYTSFRFLVNTMLSRKTSIRVNLEGSELTIRSKTPDLKVALSCLRDGEFAPAISACREKHKLIVDAGGYIGTAAIAFARAFPNSRVVTLEPNASNFAVLSENVRAYKNIVPLRKALSNYDGEIELFSRPSGEWGFTTIRQPDSTSTRDVMDCISIPTLLKELGHEGIDILKLDIEGGEKPLLENNPDWVKRVELVIAELHDYITAGCSNAFYAATGAMQQVYCSGEKVMVVRH